MSRLPQCDPVVPFTEAELFKLHRLAEARENPKALLGIRNRGEYGVKKESAHFYGLCVEYGTAKYFHEPFDFFVSLNGGEKTKANQKIDLYVGEIAVECKGTAYNPPFLKFDTVAELVTPVAILGLVINDSSVKLVGVVSQNTFREQHQMRDFKHGMKPSMADYEMEPVQSLAKFAEKKRAVPPRFLGLNCWCQTCQEPRYAPWLPSECPVCKMYVKLGTREA